ncbi:hypothetical protein [Dialister invisus]|jgi:hypothetical protein|uniref:hypothetical protein n=1 Tax=Dialister invisus TaxID=218538 RepID=UPI003AAEC9FB
MGELVKKEKEKFSKKVFGAAENAAGLAAGNSVNASVERLGQVFAKPEKYDRKLYDSPSAKINAKKEAFLKGNPKDPYTNKRLELRKQDAKLKYGKDWQSHLAESDHTVSLKKVHGEYRKDSWMTNEDIKEVANSKENLKVINRKLNNVKRSRTNEELVEDKEYLKKKGIKLSAKAEAQMMEDSRAAREHIRREAAVKQVKNAATAFHQSGVNAACSAGTMTATVSTMQNMIAVLKGEKKAEDALKDIAVETGRSGAVAYAVGGALTTVSHTLSSSSSEFVKALAKSNVPGKVVSSVMATGDLLYRYAKSEISTADCILGLGERGTGMLASGYSAALGQALIPIPFVGAAVGAMVGTAVSGGMWNSLKQSAENAKLAQEEYERVKVECDRLIAQMRYEKKIFEEATGKLFAERAIAINEGFNIFYVASSESDFDKMGRGLERIAEAFGKTIGVCTFDEFDRDMKDGKIPFNL